MRIGAVAQKVGISIDAIRFYERSTLLPRPPRTQGGFRQYAEADVDTLLFIRRAQQLGFSLREVRGFLRLRSNSSRPCEQVRRQLSAKLADVKHKMAELRSLEQELRAALRSCGAELRKGSAGCPILKERFRKQEMRIES